MNVTLKSNNSSLSFKSINRWKEEDPLWNILLKKKIRKCTIKKENYKENNEPEDIVRNDEIMAIERNMKVVKSVN